jgi:hypothetical protein
MLSRGYDGEAHLMPLPPFSAGTWLWLSAGIGFLALLLAFGILFWG